MKGFKPGDFFVAYLKGHGFVGVGRVKTEARMVREARVNGKRLLALPLRCRNMSDNEDDPDRSEYVCLVEWLKSVGRNDAKWRSQPKLYTTTHVRASLDGQPSTMKFVEEAFGINLRDMLRTQ
jgi:hypothetical protein